MDEKFKKLVVAYVLNLVILIVMVVILILSSQGIVPDIFRPIALVCLVADCIWFASFTKKYK